jgi:hypothetical protein
MHGDSGKFSVLTTSDVGSDAGSVSFDEDGSIEFDAEDIASGLDQPSGSLRRSTG